MNAIRISTVLVGASLIAMGASAGHAQVKRPAPDENGVDVISGGLMIASGRLTVGQPAEGGLAFFRIWDSDGWYHNLVGTIGAAGSKYSVTVGASVETFTLSGGVYQSDDGLGSTLTYASSVYTYTTADGTVMTFEDPGSADYAGSGGGLEGIITSITRPNGHSMTMPAS